jgi:hypothetical protein
MKRVIGDGGLFERRLLDWRRVAYKPPAMWHCFGNRVQ